MRNPHGQFYSIPAHLNNCGTQLISLSRDNLLSLIGLWWSNSSAKYFVFRGWDSVETRGYIFSLGTAAVLKIFSHGTFEVLKIFSLGTFAVLKIFSLGTFAAVLKIFSLGTFAVLKIFSLGTFAAVLKIFSLGTFAVLKIFSLGTFEVLKIFSLGTFAVWRCPAGPSRGGMPGSAMPCYAIMPPLSRMSWMMMMKNIINIAKISQLILL